MPVRSAVEEMVKKDEPSIKTEAEICAACFAGIKNNPDQASICRPCPSNPAKPLSGSHASIRV